jgi:hypothetical protein
VETVSPSPFSYVTFDNETSFNYKHDILSIKNSRLSGVAILKVQYIIITKATPPKPKHFKINALLL